MPFIPEEMNAASLKAQHRASDESRKATAKISSAEAKAMKRQQDELKREEEKHEMEGSESTKHALKKMESTFQQASETADQASVVPSHEARRYLLMLQLNGEMARLKGSEKIKLRGLCLKAKMEYKAANPQQKEQIYAFLKKAHECTVIATKELGDFTETLHPVENEGARKQEDSDIRTFLLQNILAEIKLLSPQHQELKKLSSDVTFKRDFPVIARAVVDLKKQDTKVMAAINRLKNSDFLFVKDYQHLSCDLPNNIPLKKLQDALVQYDSQKGWMKNKFGDAKEIQALREFTESVKGRSLGMQFVTRSEFDEFMKVHQITIRPSNNTDLRARDRAFHLLGVEVKKVTSPPTSQHSMRVPPMPGRPGSS